MKVLIVGTRHATIPGDEGRAIEAIINKYLLNNKKEKNIEFVVYSKYEKELTEEVKSKYINVEFRYINKSSFKYKIYRLIFGPWRRIVKNKIGDEFVRCMVDDIKKRNEKSAYQKKICLNNINNIGYIDKKINGDTVIYLHNDYLNKNVKNGEYVLKHADAVWCVSNYIKKQVDSICSNNKTRVIYNGVDINKFDKFRNKDKIDSIRRSLKISNDDFIITYVGRIIPEKGITQLINAFIKLNKKYKRMKLIIIGKATDSKVNFEKELRDYTKQFGNIFWEGSKSHDEICQYYGLTNVQVIPTIGKEAFGLTAVEGMSARVPVIVSNSGGLKEIVKNNCALSINIENIEKEIYNAIEKIYKISEEDIKKIIDAAYERVQEFSIEKYYKNMDILIKG